MTDGRRTLNFQSADELAGELQRLRRLPLKQRGTWTLPQACRHLTTVIEDNLTPPESNIPTAEQTAKKEGIFKLIFAPGGMPEGMPSGKTAPPADCTDADVDGLLAAFHTLAVYPHEFIKVGSCGPVPVADVVRLHLAHAAHHLSFQEPAVQPRNDLKYPDESAAIADVQWLRKGHHQIGNWTLEQMCWHMGTILKFLMQPPKGQVTPQTPEQRAILESVLSSGKIRKGVDAPPQVLPPESAGDESVDLYIRKMNEMTTYAGPWTPHRMFGPISPDDYRKLTLIHAAHHFANLIPTTDH
jgi:hypothetical protein